MNQTSHSTIALSSSAAAPEDEWISIPTSDVVVSPLHARVPGTSRGLSDDERARRKKARKQTRASRRKNRSRK